MSNELTVIPDTFAMAVSRTPEEVLAEAHKAASALQRVIDAKPKKLMFNGEQYLEFDDWQTVGNFYGIAPKVTSTKYVTYGDSHGWEAIAEAIHVQSQLVVSSGEAMCMDDETKWSARPKYAWVYHKKSGGTSVEDPGRDEIIWEHGNDGKNRPKKSKELIGTEKVPQFQLRSMAQTRACAKAMKNALAWVVVLAGYRPTPAEELDTIADFEHEDHSEPRKQEPLRQESGEEPWPVQDKPEKKDKKPTQSANHYKALITKVQAEIASRSPTELGSEYAPFVAKYTKEHGNLPQLEMEGLQRAVVYAWLKAWIPHLDAESLDQFEDAIKGAPIRKPDIEVLLTAFAGRKAEFVDVPV